ncbi:MAG TPA: helix-turn-helix transcriptional regulator [Clostridiales bacterium]|nr:helix-turn-helix transcriptional regulator [Clostridiales bacterium]
MSRLGQKLADIRTKKGLLPKDLAKKAGVSEKFLLEVEEGKRILNENLATRLSKILGVNLNENGDFYASLEERKAENKPAETAKPVHSSFEHRNSGITQAPAPQWEQAFTSIIRDVPVYDSTLSKVISSKKLVIQDNKVEGIPQDKAFYIKLDEKQGERSRFQEGDLVLIHKMNEIQKAGIYLIRRQEKVQICEAKPLDNKRLLLGSPRGGTLSAEAVNIQDITVMGKCVRVETAL